MGKGKYRYHLMVMVIGQSPRQRGKFIKVIGKIAVKGLRQARHVFFDFCLSLALALQVPISDGRH